MLPAIPLLFEPYLRPMPWGGRRLEYWLNRQLPAATPIGEAWLLSDHPLHESRVVGGPLAGTTLRQLVRDEGRTLFGREIERFPLLVKLLDARENLSIQVHPDDELARRWSPGEGGKTEAWYVLEADSGAAIRLGLKPGIDRSTLARRLEGGDLADCLECFGPAAGECYYVPAGTIHGLGGGLVVCEVQQTSDATFRLYDWGRVDAEGKPRPLHLEAGLACTKERPAGVGRQNPRPIAAGVELLVETTFFRMERWRIAQPGPAAAPLILVGLSGTVAVETREGSVTLDRGTAALIPAAAATAAVLPHGPAELLAVRMPA